MEIKEETKIKKDGTYQTTKSVHITKEDGLIKESDINDVSLNHFGEYHIGTDNRVITTTNDPRIIKPIVYGICTILFVSGLIIMLTCSVFFGILFILFTAFATFHFRRDINKQEKELLKNPNYNPKDKMVVKNFQQEIKTDFQNSAKQTFTKKAFKKLLKLAIPICIFVLIISTFITYFIGGFLIAMIVFGIVFLVELIYLFILSKICKY